MVSPEYPAVLVGDAAVTPHPDTGMGYTTGFRGFEEVRLLLGALRRTANDAGAFLSFNARYEIDVAQKALSGTQGICDSNIGLLKNYKESLEKLGPRSGESSTRAVFDADIKLIDAYIKVVEGHKRDAAKFEKLVSAHQAILPDRLWDEGPSWLWESMGLTWERINRLTNQTSLLQPQLKALQAAIVKQYKKDVEQIKQDVRKQIVKDAYKGSGSL